MDPASKPRVVRGEIELPPGAPPVSPARVRVELEDVSRADAPSQVIASCRLKGRRPQRPAPIPFELEVPAGLIDERHRYSIRVHIDLGGTGEVEKGDYVTVQSYPVLTLGHGDHVRVAVRRV